jgi:hypothetical protein
MENKVRETKQQNRGEISSRESNQSPVVKRVCCDHENKEKSDCCGEAILQTT